jgi:hypothetical protein
VGDERREAFLDLLGRASAELYDDNSAPMETGALVPTLNRIAPDDVELFDAGPQG